MFKTLERLRPLRFEPTPGPKPNTSDLCRLQWIGPPDDESVQRCFDDMFKRTTETSGDCFFIADDQRVKDDVLKRLEKRGLNCDAVAENCFPLTRDLLVQCLPPGAAQRFAKYEQLRPLRQGIEDGCFICDVQQWPDVGCSSYGPQFPCQLTHGTVVSLERRRIALGLEHLLAQGFHVLPEVSGTFRSPLTPLFEKMQCESIKRLSGNAINLPAFAAWMVFVLCNCVPADPRASQLPRMLSQAAPVESDDQQESESQAEAVEASGDEQIGAASEGHASDGMPEMPEPEPDLLNKGSSSEKFC